MRCAHDDGLKLKDLRIANVEKERDDLQGMYEKSVELYKSSEEENRNLMRKLSQADYQKEECDRQIIFFKGNLEKLERESGDTLQ